MPTKETYSKAKRIEDEEVVVRKKSSTSTTKKRKRKKKKKHSYFLWVALVIALIPCIAVVYILISAMSDTGKPINGDRFANDLNPAITETMQTTILNDIKGIEGVEDAKLTLTTATLRVVVDMYDDKTKEDALAIGQSAVDIINAHAPISTYFTSYGVSKMYDFEINVYDELSSDIKPEVNVIFTKNASHETVVHQVLTEPKNPEKVAEIEAKREAAKAEAEAAKGEGTEETPKE
ncbi:MAG: hypothetical protein IKM20_02485 [Erysipelotrichales bacterium]|nr:hypothetical protein [Erysipelotrichales bacterium]